MQRSSGEIRQYFGPEFDREIRGKHGVRSASLERSYVAKVLRVKFGNTGQA